MTTYPTTSPSSDAVFAEVAPPAGTATYTATQAEALAAVQRALGRQPRHPDTGQYQPKNGGQE